MSRLPFDPGFAQLPDALPVFPLPGVLLLPGGRLPLNIFERRYLAMIRDALAGPRLIGMVQPLNDEGDDKDVGARPIYATGRAGRITAFNETEDGRYVITLSGLIRFDVTEELSPVDGYRRVRPDWSAYATDLAAAEADEIDRERLLAALRVYFDTAGISGDWEAIEQTGNEHLVTSLAMICPFEPNEKQALLQAATLQARAEAMTQILEMAALDIEPDEPRH